jgi:hypothetical protein
VDVLYSTLAGQLGTGLQSSTGAIIEGSILFGNTLGDTIGVSCASVFWSSIGTQDCSAVNGNVFSDPLLAADYQLAGTSPCLDILPNPQDYTGDPEVDLSGGPRLRDHDGDGLAQIDAGAFERENPALTPAEVQGVTWLNATTLQWDAVASAVEYHVYRGDLSSLDFGFFGSCRDGLDGDRTDVMLVDGFFNDTATTEIYTITAEDAISDEGTLGFGYSAERSNFNSCP